MPFSIACKDAGMTDCAGSFATESRAELMEHVALHAKISHPDMKMDDATKLHIDEAMKTI